MAEVVNARSSDDRHERPDVRAVDRGEWRHDCREYLREFMEAYGQEVGYSVAQVSMRAGHDPSIAAKHYSSRVSETDRALATVVASLLDPERS